MCILSVRAADLDSLALADVVFIFWTYAGWSSGIFQWWCRKLQEETVGTGCLCPAAPPLSGTSTTPSLPRGMSAERMGGTWNPETLGKLQEWTLWWGKECKANNGKVKHAATPHWCSCACICTHTQALLWVKAAKHWHCSSSLLSPAPKWLSSKTPYRKNDNRPYLILWRW